MSTWFETLCGFEEKNPDFVRSQLELDGNQITSKANGKSWVWGNLEIPNLAKLRQTSRLSLYQESLSLREAIGNVQDFHLDTTNAGAFFQAASQFNLLEMVDPHTTPEEGIGIYQYDRTQGPACAIVCGPGTIYRNYFGEVSGQAGQTAENQVDCLADIGEALGNADERLWRMQNGYALIRSEEALEEIDHKIRSLNLGEREELKSRLRIGIQWDTQVTPNASTHLVSQAYCSALPVAYNSFPTRLWESFARLVLEASYEATLHAALINYQKSRNAKVFLTLLGGGAFGNDEDWIFESIQTALAQFAQSPLELIMLSYGQSNPRIAELIP